MITIKNTKKVDGVEITFGDDKSGGGLTILIKNEDLPKLESNLDNLLKLATDYLNQNYISLHERRQGTAYFKPNGDKM